MTPERIAELREIIDAATPGPWQNSYLVLNENTRRMPSAWLSATMAHERRVIRGPGIIGDPGCNVVMVIDGRNSLDRNFIVAARTALPDALDAIERVRALCGEATQRLNEVGVASTGRERFAKAVLATLEGKP